jgi:DNA invertase Pin-like site-specific DNA recombinase
VLIPYIRQSKAKEKTISLDDQRRSIKAWAKANDVKLAPEVVEQGVSGSKSWKERALGQAIAECEAGTADGVIVAFQDRLSRENGLATAEVWDALDKAGARLVCSSEGLDTLNGNDDDELVFSMKAALARQQWKRHRRNWQNAKHAAFERGQYLADLPAGYSRAEGGGLVPNEHAEVVRRAFELRASTPRASWGEVADVFSDAGIVTRFGSTEWSPAALRFLITNETYTGLYRCTCGCGESVVRPEWEVVPGWLYRKAQTAAAEKPKAVQRGNGHPLGQGLVRCGTCGAGLTRSKPGSGYILRCETRGPGHVTIKYDVALDWVMLEASRAIGWTKPEGNDKEAVAAEAALADARAALAEAEEFIGVSLPAGSIQRLAVTEAEDALARIDRSDIPVSRFLTPLGTKQAIEALPVAEQRRVLGSVIARVVVSKDKGSAGERAQVRAGSRHPAASRLRIEFVDGSVSPPPYDPAIAEAIAEALAPERPELLGCVGRSVSQ